MPARSPASAPLAVAVTDDADTRARRRRRRDRFHVAGGIAHPCPGLCTARCAAGHRHDGARRSRSAPSSRRSPGLRADRAGAQHEPRRERAVAPGGACGARARRRSYDAEIFEAHHRNKVDAPSGTALGARQGGRERHVARPSTSRRFMRGTATPGHGARGTIGFSVVRGGDIVGDHRLIFAGPGEQFELAHHAQDRSGFARGALVAARWVAAGRSRDSTACSTCWGSRRPAAVAARRRPAAAVTARRRAAAVYPQPRTTIQDRCSAEDRCPAHLVGERRIGGGIAESSRQPFARSARDVQLQGPRRASRLGYHRGHAPARDPTVASASRRLDRVSRGPKPRLNNRR